MDVSVIVPARNEEHLERTLRSIVKAARSDYEILAVLDGYLPDPQIDMQNHRVLFVHNDEPLGQRGAINQAAKMARGKYILKTDAHSMFDDGFDVKLMQDCEYDWTVIPRMYTLDVATWQPKKRKKTDYMFIRSPDAAIKPFRVAYWQDADTYRHFPEEYRAWKRWARKQPLIADVMTGQGACWFMHLDRFWELGGLDEAHGHWGQMGVEIALKAWLSGGRHVVNKKTWFAHLFRNGFPWPASARKQEAARKYSREFWTSGQWPLQRRPLSWLVDKFAPVPTWNGSQSTPQRPQNGRRSKKAPAPAVSDLSLLYYTGNALDGGFAAQIRKNLVETGLPVVSVSQKPIDFGHNVCVGEIGRSLQNIYQQVWEGLKHVKTEYVALVEDDCLYVAEHFEHRPKVIAYNLNRWLLHADRDKPPIYSYRRRPILSQCIAPTKALIAALEPRMKLASVPTKYSGEPGLFEAKLNLPKVEYETFETKEPNVVICHKANTSGKKYIGKDAEPRTDLPPWGDATKLIESTIGETQMAKFGRSAKPRRQHSYIGSIIFPMDEIMENIVEYRDRRRPKERALRRMASMPVFIKQILDGQTFTDEQLTKLPYYANLTEMHRTGHAKSIRLMRDMERLVHDIRDNGVKAPLDMWRNKDGSLTLHRGWRRLLIMHQLGYPRVCVRLFKTMELFRRYNPSADWTPGPADGTSIHDLAVRQFVKKQHHATDKYWVHGYTRLYDRYLGHLQNAKMKVLEFGILRGASLLLWHDAFPAAQIYGVDKNKALSRAYLRGKKRITAFFGRQEDEAFLDNIVIPAGPYRVIIDDCGHWPEQQFVTWRKMWPHLESGGYFVIEDLHGNYWKRQNRAGPLMADELKHLIDVTLDGTEIRSVNIHYNIAFIQKV